MRQIKSLVFVILGVYSLNTHSVAQVFNKEKQNLEVSLLQNTLVTKVPEATLIRENSVGLGLFFWGNLNSGNKDSLNLRSSTSDLNLFFNEPRIGIYAETIFNLDTVLGVPYTLGIASDILFLKKENVYFSFRPRFGLTYFTKKYNPANTGGRFFSPNVLIGSNLNVNVQLGLYFTVNKWGRTFKIGANFSHFSNGSFSLPNGGVNLINTSFAYQFGPQRTSIEREVRKEYIKESKENKLWVGYVQGGLFSKEIEPVGERFTGSHVLTGFGHQVNKVFEVSLMANWLKDNSISEEASFYGVENYKNDRLGVGLGLGVNFYKVKVLVNLGKYWYKPEKVLDRDFYQYYQINYSVVNHMYIFLGGMLHMNSSDFIDLGVGLEL